MFICDRCKTEFDKPISHTEDHGEIFFFSPCCGDTDFSEKETYKGYTKEGIENLFSLELGLKYIEHYNLEKDYYPYVKHIEINIEQYEDDEVELLLPVLKQIFKLRVEQNGSFCPAADFINDLMEFCLEDWTHFADFSLDQAEKEMARKVG